MAKQCLIAAIQYKPETGASANKENNLQQLKISLSPPGGPDDEKKCEDLDKVIIGDDLERFFQVGALLPLQEKEKLVKLLKRNVDVFAWDAYEAPGLNQEFICHHLNVDPSATPRKQSSRHPSNEHVEAIKSKVVKLKQAGAIKEIFYPQWLANTMVVKKKTGKCCVCVDFIDLNKACPKDPFPMPMID